MFGVYFQIVYWVHAMDILEGRGVKVTVACKKSSLLRQASRFDESFFLQDISSNMNQGDLGSAASKSSPKRFSSPDSVASKRHCLGLDLRIPPAGFSPAKSAAATDVVRGHVNHILP